MYDAAAAVSGGYRPYHVSPVVPPGASLDAAVATAAHHILLELFPDQQVALDQAYDASLAGIPEGRAEDDGIDVGRQVGTGFFDLPAVEGLNATVPYIQPPAGPGVYEPTAGATPLGTKLPLVVPLALDQASQFRPDGPLTLRSRSTQRTSGR